MMKKTKVARSWSKHNLPSDLWPEILSRLPAKSVLRFRCVTKSWQAVIDDPDFCHSHLNNFNNNLQETRLFAVQERTRENFKVCSLRSSDTFKSLHSFDTKPLGENWNVVSYMDGLFMLQYDTPTKELKLWNPSIERVRALPNPPLISRKMSSVDLGFGFDPLLKDYKHVRLVMRPESRNLDSIEVYTVGTGLWKTIEFRGKGIYNWWVTSKYHSSIKTVCFKGMLYFIATRQNLVDEELVSFDLSNEVFASNQKLPGLDSKIIWEKYMFKAVTLVDGGSSLGLVYHKNGKASLWVSRDPGDDTLWIGHDYEYEFIGRNSSHLLCLKKNREMLLQWYSKDQVASFNFETLQEKILLKNSRSRFDFRMVCGYVESLVLRHG